MESQTGRWGGRASEKSGVRDNIQEDATPEQIAKVRRLYERPGTPGEKVAAREVLKRMGVSEREIDQPASVWSFGSSKPQASKPASRLKSYEVIFQYDLNGAHKYTGSFIIHNATDQVDAEAKARVAAKKWWQTQGGGKSPEFRAYRTTKIDY